MLTRFVHPLLFGLAVTGLFASYARADRFIITFVDLDGNSLPSPTLGLPNAQLQTFVQLAGDPNPDLRGARINMQVTRDSAPLPMTPLGAVTSVTTVTSDAAGRVDVTIDGPLNIVFVANRVGAARATAVVPFVRAQASGAGISQSVTIRVPQEEPSPALVPCYAPTYFYYPVHNRKHLFHRLRRI
jgi:hypothetical protein